MNFRHIWVPDTQVNQVPSQTNQLLSNQRIIGGTDADPDTIGYQAGLVINGRGFCGGSLIRDDFVLTAAHCVDDALETQVVLGHHSIHEALNTQQVLVSREHHVHPQWNPTVLQNDVALIRIPLIDLTNPTLQIIPLAPGNAPSFSGSIGLLSGWGITSDGSDSIAPHLQIIYLEIISNVICRLYFLGQVIENQHICTSGSLGDVNVGACSGDSGGPLVVSGLQVGIVSFGVIRCSAGFPSVYARVSSFSDFINTILSL